MKEEDLANRTGITSINESRKGLGIKFEIGSMDGVRIGGPAGFGSLHRKPNSSAWKVQLLG